MKALILQIDIAWRDKQANFRKVESLLAAADVSPGDLVVLPEMFATGFDVDADSIAEAGPDQLGMTGVFLSGIASRYQIHVQGGGIAHGLDGRLRNLAVAYAPDGRQVSSFAKLHPFRHGGEHLRFEAGEGLSSWAVGGFQACPLVCYDLRFPEVFRRAARAGADLFLVIANWPESRQAHWNALLRARAIENQAYVVGANRCGKDPKLSYAGGSAVYGPRGEELALAGDTETVLAVELLPHAVQEWRTHFPVLQDIRDEFL